MKREWAVGGGGCVLNDFIDKALTTSAGSYSKMFDMYLFLGKGAYLLLLFVGP